MTGEDSARRSWDQPVVRVPQLKAEFAFRVQSKNPPSKAFATMEPGTITDRVDDVRPWPGIVTPDIVSVRAIDSGGVGPSAKSCSQGSYFELSFRTSSNATRTLVSRFWPAENRARADRAPGEGTSPRNRIMAS